MYTDVQNAAKYNIPKYPDTQSEEGELMTRIDSTVCKETKYIAYFVLMLSFLMQAVFLILGKWDYTVLSGNLLSGIAVVLNFLFMGIGIQKAVLKDEKDAKAAIRLSQSYRMLFMLVVIVIGVVTPCFNMWAVIIPVVFPRIAIAFRTLFDRR